ncbi:MAG: hypothetical protein BRC37_04395 [Cyanobacteria bacterium QH_3_48_40]|nr:MAG: hypothetical protein BRC37_04395 [Cyanobacteria bacterium QH_3_48_40]
MLTNWEETYSDDGPALEDDDQGELLQQSMSLELDELIQEPEPIVRQQQAPSPTTEESVAGEVEKATLLEAFDSEVELAESQAQAETAVTHSEDVTAWAEAIAQWWAARSDNEPVSLIELQHKLGMPLVEVWLGLLLGNRFELEQRGDFYNTKTILVNLGRVSWS